MLERCGGGVLAGLGSLDGAGEHIALGLGNAGLLGAVVDEAGRDGRDLDHGGVDHGPDAAALGGLLAGLVDRREVGCRALGEVVRRVEAAEGAAGDGGGGGAGVAVAVEEVHQEAVVAVLALLEGGEVAAVDGELAGVDVHRVDVAHEGAGLDGDLGAVLDVNRVAVVGLGEDAALAHGVLEGEVAALSGDGRPVVVNPDIGGVGELVAREVDGDVLGNHDGGGNVLVGDHRDGVAVRGVGNRSREAGVHDTSALVPCDVLAPLGGEGDVAGDGGAEVERGVGALSEPAEEGVAVLGRHLGLGGLLAGDDGLGLDRGAALGLEGHGEGPRRRPAWQR